jgi:hypothetical protein
MSQIQGDGGGSTYDVKVYVHYIKDPDNSIPNATKDDVQETIDGLQSNFNPHDISFTWNCFIDYISDDDHIYLTDPNAIYEVNGHLDGVDIYLFDESYNLVPLLGRANGIGENTAYWVAGLTGRAVHSFIFIYVLLHNSNCLTILLVN